MLTPSALNISLRMSTL